MIYIWYVNNQQKYLFFKRCTVSPVKHDSNCSVNFSDITISEIFVKIGHGVFLAHR